MAEKLLSSIRAWLSRPRRRVDQSEAERALREANERFELVLAGADAAIWDWDVPRHKAALSSRWKAMRGFAEHEIGDDEKEWSERIHPDDAARVIAAVEAHFEGKTPFFAEEYRVRRKDGSWMWIADRGLARRDADGRVVRMAGSETDITDRKQVEAALDSQRQLLETVINQMPAAVCLIRGSDLRLQLVNPAYQAIAPGKAMQGKTLDELWPETGQDFAAICRRVLESGEPHRVVDELNMIRRQPDGPLEQAYFTWSMDRVRLPGGEGWGLLNVAWETSARRMVESQIQHLAQQRQLALDAAKLGWWEYNPITRIATWDDGYKAIFGVAGYTLPNEEILQQIIHPEDLSGLWDKVEAALDPADPHPFVAEYRINRPDGQMRWVKAHGIASFDGEGDARRAVGFLGTVEDITERKTADEALRVQTEELAALLDALPAYVWFGDAECRFITGNRAASEMTGVAPGANISQSAVASGEAPYLRQLKPDGTEYRVEELPMQRAVATRRPVLDAMIDFRFRDGRRVQTMGNAVPLFDAEGAVRGSVAAFLDITKRAEAEEALRASEHRFRQVVESLPQLVWTCRADGHCDYLSPQWIRYTGIPEEPQLGYGWLEQLHPEDRDRTIAAWNAAAARGGAFAAEFRIRRNDGVYRLFRTLAVPLRDDAGNILKWFGTNTDIQDIEDAERAVRASEARLRLAQASAGAGMWDWDIANGKIAWSDELFRLFGLDPEAGEASFEVWRSVLHPDDRLLADQRIQAAVAGRTHLANEYRIVLPSGEVRWVNALGQATYEPDGTPLRMTGICIDVTERKLVEEQSRDRENELQLVTNTVPALIAYIDRELRYRRVNRMSHLWFGIAPDQMKGCQVREVIGESAWELKRPHLERAMAGEKVTYEERMPYLAGGPRWVATTLVPDLDSTGVVQGVVMLVTDISELKQVEQQLRESLAEKELLLREVHHRVKNNLQVISSLVNLQADALADPALRAVFGDVRDRVRSMGLVHEKLYESGGLAKLNFADYAAGLTHSLWSAHRAAESRVRLQLEVEPVALSVATAVPCGLILNELVSNALKHAFPSGGGVVTVGLAREPGTGWLCLRVHDDGVGMPAGFDWRRARSLGLRLVQMLAGQLGGTVETGAGPGTEFRVSFVAKESEEPEVPVGATSAETSGGRP